MCNRLVTALAVAVTAGAASAQVAGLSARDTNAPWANPTTTQIVTSSGSLTNSVLAGPGAEEQGSIDLGPTMDKPFVVSSQLWRSDVMAIDGGAGRSLVDPDSIQVQREALFQKLNLLVRADIRSSPFHFGVDSEVKFVEHHDHQPGIPAPVGISYRRGQQRLAFFAELAPILETSPSTSLEWGGGLGIRLYLGR